jgi:geranylgeranyl pyrophosphate synthase
VSEFLSGLIRAELTRQADRYIQQEKLHNAVVHLLGRGKLYRPRLALAAYEALSGDDPTQWIPAVTPLELIHTFTLIHDDLPCMDDAKLRRGVGAVHVEFDEATAVLAGDALCNMAFQVLCDHDLHIDAGKALKLVASLSGATQEVVVGQVKDLAAEGQTLLVQQVLEIYGQKTGALLVSCLEFGAILADASAFQLAGMTSLGTGLGTLFQLRDDLLGAESHEGQTGKSHTDKALAKSTLVSILGVETAMAQAASFEAGLEALVGKLALRSPEILLSAMREAYHREK